jgi:hypothetical protein
VAGAQTEVCATIALGHFVPKSEGQASVTYGSGRSCAAAQEVENEKNKTNHEQKVDESRANVERQKSEQPENDQNYREYGKHVFLSQV